MHGHLNVKIIIVIVNVHYPLNFMFSFIIYSLIFDSLYFIGFIFLNLRPKLQYAAVVWNSVASK